MLALILVFHPPVHLRLLLSIQFLRSTGYQVVRVKKSILSHTFDLCAPPLEKKRESHRNPDGNTDGKRQKDGKRDRKTENWKDIERKIKMLNDRIKKTAGEKDRIMK